MTYAGLPSSIFIGSKDGSGRTWLWSGAGEELVEGEQLNLCPDKMEVLIVGPVSILGNDCEVMLDEVVVLPRKDEVRSLGVLLDLTFLLNKTR